MILLSNGGTNIQVADAPSDAILVGNVDGVALLERDGEHWRVAHKALAGCSVSAVTASTDGTLYAATHGVGVARSHDGGRSWNWCNTGLAHYDLWSARAGTLRGKAVVLAGSLPAHLYLSENGGDSWRELTAFRQAKSVGQWCFPPPPRVGHIKDIVIAGDRLYAGVEIGALQVSDDGGETFRELRLDPSPRECDVHRLLVHPERPGRLIVANGLVGLMRSDDDGQTFTRLPMPPKANYPDPVVLDPGRPDTLFMTAGVGWPPHWYKEGRARGKIFRSDDAGKTWTRLLGGLPDGQRATFSALTIERAGDAMALYAADTDGQVFESRDEGTHWTVIADVAPVSKGEFHLGLKRDRVKLAHVDDVVVNETAAQRWAEAVAQG